jgi:glycosyltransferase involved in cell wall biosynthesis
MPNVTIYILCFNDEKLNIATRVYSKYSWAKLILLKYQDYTLENSFWRQMNEIEHEWENCDMVGTLSYSAFKKINLDEVNEIIENQLYYPNKYYHFMDSNVPIPNSNTNKHPNFLTIWNDILEKLSLKTTTENCCNYWMCAPELMKHFITWYNTICFPELTKHPLIFTDSNYTSDNNIIMQDRLIKLWGKPYYPHYVFIVERLNKCFFETYYPDHVEKVNNFSWEFYINNNVDLRHFNKVRAKEHYYKCGQFENRICCDNQDSMNLELSRYNNLIPKIVFLISHENQKGGAQNCLFNLEKIYQINGNKTILLYLPEIQNINIVEYILNTSRDNKCCPVVFCNTLSCYNLVQRLSKTRILTYWYIHEWFDNFSRQFFQLYIQDHSIFNSSIHPIFVCNSSLRNYLNYIPTITNYHIIYNTYSTTNLDTLINECQTRIIKENDTIYLSIIGTIEQRKNQQAFIDNVFYRLKDKYSNIKLLIVGRVSKNLVINSFYENDIINIGLVDNALPYINLSDIIVSYSINEVLPMNIIESFYCEKPVVSSNVGGISEMIDDKYNGYLFDTNDHDKCFNILCDLVEDENLRRDIGIKAKQKFFENFDEKTVIDKFISLLKY